VNQKIGRQIIFFNPSAIGSQDDQTLYEILQFPDIAGPRIGFQNA